MRMPSDEVERVLRERVERRRFRLKDIDQLKTVDDVFNEYTLEALRELMNKGVIEEIYGPVAQGKEAKVIWGIDREGNDLAIKIFYTTTAQFIRGRYRYMIGDPRMEGFKLSNIRKIVELWCRKEFGNLVDAFNAGVRVPRPITFKRNILVMEFISFEGQRGIPAPLIKECPPDDPEEAYLTILKYVERAYILGKIIHADLSEYNIVNTGKELVIIDWGSAVKIHHPSAVEFLLRDVQNVNRFFEKELDVRTYDAKAVVDAILRRYEMRDKIEGEDEGWLIINGKRLIDEL